MSDITVHPHGPHEWTADVREGTLSTSHLVRIDANLVDELGIVDLDEQRLVHETLDYLLKAEKLTEIPHDLDLGDLRRDDPDYLVALQTRLRP